MVGSGSRSLLPAILGLLLIVGLAVTYAMFNRTSDLQDSCRSQYQSQYAERGTPADMGEDAYVRLCQANANGGH